MNDISFLWIDLETTGLYGIRKDNTLGEDYHDIIEVGYFMTDHKFEVISPRRNFVVQHDIKVIKEKCNDYVFNMHSNNGLFSDIEYSNTHTLKHIEEKIIKDIYEFCGENKVQLAGSSIHFDKKFINHQMKKLSEILHYRNFDVSTIETLCKCEGIEYYHPDDNENVDHRAIYDINNSLTKLKSMKDILISNKGDNDEK